MEDEEIQLEAKVSDLETAAYAQRQTLEGLVPAAAVSFADYLRDAKNVKDARVQ